VTAAAPGRFQGQPAIIEIEIGLTCRPYFRITTAGDIVRDEAEYQGAEAISVEETSRSQKGLVYAIRKNPAIDHSCSRELF
jgi:hypothetical protein